MWCFSRRFLCREVTSKAGVSSQDTTSVAAFSFTKRLKQLQEDCACPLSGPEYSILRLKLEYYRSLQNAYAVKQSDIERAKRAGQCSGLEFTPKVARKVTAHDE